MSKTTDTVTLHVPFTIRKYGGRKQVITPNGAPAAIEKPRVDSTLVKALARAFRWKKMLESGQFTTITELAKHENLALTYMTRVLRLSLLAPDIVEMILAGRQPPEMTLAALLEPLPVEWEGQKWMLYEQPAPNVLAQSS
ncbi:MAG: hypothetical protein COB39_12240 [Marinosulfonomonas sp.]|nr:MAG: hypothetical protein COB39_12240 [Marinosulfonomonas sp.]